MIPKVLTIAPLDSEYYGGQHSSVDIGVTSTSGTFSGTSSGNYTSTPTTTTVITPDQLVQSGNTEVNTTTVTTPISTTTTTPSLATSPIVSNTTSPISLVPGGMAGGGTGAGNSTENPKASNGGAKESLLDKWKKLSDWKKGLIILAIAAGSYYGYKQLK